MRFQTLTRLLSAMVVGGACIIFGTARAADFTLRTSEKAARKEIGETIRSVLQTKAIQLLDGDKPVLEIWLRNEFPLKAKPASATDRLSAIGETTLLGVIVVTGNGLRDYKDNEIPSGTYTARFGLQPQDGDHLGTAEFNYFLVLISADMDKELSGMSQFKPMTKASGKLTSSGHPMVVSLRPAPSSDGLPKLTEPAADHKAIRLQVPGKVGSAGEKIEVAFDLVYKGTGHIQ